MRPLLKTLLSLLFLAQAGTSQRQLLLTSSVVSGASSINTTPTITVGASHNDLTVNFGATTAGRLLTVQVSNEGSGNSVSSISSAVGNTYSLACKATNASNTIELWYAKNTAGGTETATVTLTGDNYTAGQEWSGADTTTPLDACVTTTSSTAGPVTTSLDNELLLVTWIAGTAGTSCVSGFTVVTNDVFNQYFVVLRKGATTAGSYSGTSCDGTVNVARVMAAFK